MFRACWCAPTDENRSSEIGAVQAVLESIKADPEADVPGKHLFEIPTLTDLDIVRRRPPARTRVRILARPIADQYRSWTLHPESRSYTRYLARQAIFPPYRRIPYHRPHCPVIQRHQPRNRNAAQPSSRRKAHHLRAPQLHGEGKASTMIPQEKERTVISKIWKSSTDSGKVLERV
jgi:hypothetical protein